MQYNATYQRASSFPARLAHGAIIGAGMQGPVVDAPLPGKEFDHRRQFGSRDQRSAPSPIFATEYNAERRAFLYAERFCNITSCVRLAFIADRATVVDTFL